MKEFIELLMSDIGKWVAGAIILIFGVIGVHARGAKSARDKIEAKNAKQVVKDHKDRRTINESVEEEVHDDIDLMPRVRRAGVLRGGDDPRQVRRVGKNPDQ